jgi:hypothetical protein
VESSTKGHQNLVKASSKPIFPSGIQVLGHQNPVQVKFNVLTNQEKESSSTNCTLEKASNDQTLTFNVKGKVFVKVIRDFTLIRTTKSFEDKQMRFLYTRD